MVNLNELGSETKFEKIPAKKLWKPNIASLKDPVINFRNSYCRSLTRRKFKLNHSTQPKSNTFFLI